MPDSSPTAEPRTKPGLAAWAVVAAFGTYFCVYGFRKPFTAAGYTDIYWGLGFKTLLVTAQVFGYMLAKFLGIKVVSEVRPERRVGMLLGLLAAAEASLVLFGLSPPPFNAIWLFANGLTLGMTFGLVLGFLEGRRNTEMLTAGLCASFILADGVTKDVGTRLLNAGVDELWMPSLAGLLFIPPLLGFLWMLARIPKPSAADVAARSERVPMGRDERRAFFRRYALGLVLLVLSYLLITILRSLRADYAPEIWEGLLGRRASPERFSQSEVLVAAGVLLLIAAMVLIRDNRLAFFVGMGLSVLGLAIITITLLLLQAGAIAPFPFMVLHGIGLYLPYIAVHTTIFERLIAMTRDRGNIGYLMYLADSFGYLGYVGVLLIRNAIGPIEDFLNFFVLISWGIAGGCLLLLIPCWHYFAVHPATRNAA